MLYRTNMPLPAPDAQQGVVIFFVLSGYLIAMIVGGYLRKPGATFWPVFGKFMAGRFFRIWPAYMVSILIIQIYYSLLKGHGAFDACGYPGAIRAVQNLAAGLCICTIEYQRILNCSETQAGSPAR
jgi:peptidoglycan/LPS O-acetylase OafA/YrhL